MTDQLRGSYVNRSGTITAATNAPQLVSASKARFKFTAQNLSANNMAFIPMSTGATPSQTSTADPGCVELLPTGSWIENVPKVSSDAIWVIGTQGDPFTFIEMQ